MFRFLVLLTVLALPVLSANGHAAGSGGGNTSAQSPTDFQVARELIEQHKYAEAIPWLEKVIAKQPKNADALNELGYAYREVDEFEKALVNYDKALAIDPEHVGALNYLGMLYVETGKTAKAEALLARIDDACFFTCDEYTSLKKAIETGVVED